jgi:hypothetical protein
MREPWGGGVIEIGTGLTGLYVSPLALKWLFSGQKREYTFYIKFNNLYMCCNLNFDLTVLISLCKLSSTILPLNLYVLPPTSVLTE